ncbi:hypothetical protein GCM10010191_44050 [Actinomadura vinacea]|uniref:Phospholipid carrier-dependent glycosyltransferase n=1 Tax=Actinomadura vinacea TaxID=115336 RepID=A0ABN3JC62_9ACTN
MISPGTRSRAFLTAHWPFLILLGLGVALRVLTVLGYRWAMWFPDSFEYLAGALDPEPHPARPGGYAFFLWALRPFHSFELLIVLQHLMGLGVAVMVYALLRTRFGLPGWGASLAAAPVLLDAYEVQLEHMVMSDTLFTTLIVGAVTAAMWRSKPGPKAAALAGALLAMAALTRSIALPLVVLLLLYLVVRKAGWRPVALAAAGAAVPLALYATWFQSVHDRFALTNSSGIFLYSRAMTFVDCEKFDRPPPAREQVLCPVLPPEKRPASHFYIWGAKSVLRSDPSVPPWFSPEQEEFARGFAVRAIRAQPGDYASTVWDELRIGFSWTRPVFPDKKTYAYYEFGSQEGPLPNFIKADVAAFDAGRNETRIVEPYAGFLRGYQDHVYLRGAVLAALLAAGLAAVAAGWRRRGGPALLPWSLALAMTVIPPVTVMFDYRYQPPVIPLACVAAALALPRRTRPRPDTATPAPAEAETVPGLSPR